MYANFQHWHTSKELPAYIRREFYMERTMVSTGVRFVLPNALSSKPNIVPGGGGYRFHLRRDLLRRPLKGSQSTFAAIFHCVPTTFGNDCGLYFHSLARASEKCAPGNNQRTVSRQSSFCLVMVLDFKNQYPSMMT